MEFILGILAGGDMSDMGLPLGNNSQRAIGQFGTAGGVNNAAINDSDATIKYEDIGAAASDYFGDLSLQALNMNSDEKSDEAQQKKDARFNLVIKIIIGVLLALGLLEVVFCKIVLPSINSPIVNVSGQKNYSAVEIVDMLRAMNVTNWFAFDSERASLLISSASGIDSVTVKKSFPNKIYINVVERVPVALTFVNVDKNSVALQIDKNGVLFSEKSFKVNNSVPIISGLPINHLSEGMRIGEQYRLLIEQISDIQKLSQNYFAAISEICVVPKENGNYELIIIPAKSKIRIITDRNLNEDTLKYMMIALDVVSSIDKDAKEINMRGGVISYIK